MPILLPEDIREAFDGYAGVTDDRLLLYIGMAEGLAGKACRRDLPEAAHDDYFTILSAVGTIHLPHTPVVAVTHVYEDASGTLPTELASDDYVVEAEKGFLHRAPFGSSWYPGTRAVRVVWTAGYTRTTCPVELKAPLLALTAWTLSRLGGLGISSESADGASVTYEGPLVDGMPPAMRSALQSFVRYGRTGA